MGAHTQNQLKLHESTYFQRGLTLPEVLMAMTIFTILAAGIISAVFMVRADAENNLYEATAQNVGLSFLEQTKSITFDDLETPKLNGDGSPYITYLTGFKKYLDVPLGEDVTVEVPVISDTEGKAKKSIDVTIRVEVDEATTVTGYWIAVDYSWEHPTTKKVYAGEVRSFKSRVANY
ncbi:MAG: type IV pilus modification PilV family protein [Puniceicoccales bacterium]